ncbi:nitrous oxide reductase accessory protein NosL [Pontibacter anaerobius]|uniref:Nitrous oxide reductase accessory protein NosL n=1 Tax=Pontibacter anaerobius TaxID=2993940 RepID=A0ABT3RDL2_9BACT|nr:nitrous oxide reductase accessory protein NosL [Pontibacter anaerobius]MCX2739539.1 nitrous oxide reductase accessory protein NosL [Pontibacter anaerobius]
MKTLLHLLSLALLLAIIAGCQPEPKPIAYGQANCAHCNMTVADSRYGAELVNDKGKAIFFDSAECLMTYVKEQPEQAEKAAFLLVTDFTRPNELIDARNAHFLQTKELPSPMGMYMTAVTDKAAATKMQQELGGRLLTWNEAVTAVQNNERPE